MARVFQKRGDWWLDYLDQHGHRVRCPGAKDKEVALKMLGDAIDGVERQKAGLLHADPREARRDIDIHLRDYLGELTRRGRAPMYIYIVQKRVEAAIGAQGWKTLGDATAKSVQKFLGSLATGADKRTPRTINSYRADFSAFFVWAVEDGRLGSNPCVRVEKVADRRGKTRRALTVSECQDLLSKCSKQRRLVYHFLLMTGLRRAEATQLRWGDLRLDGLNPRVELSPAITKSGQAESVPLVPALAEELLEARGEAGDGERVFRGIPTMISFRKDLAAAGIAEVDARGRRVVLHSLRHSLATMLAASQVPMALAQRIMRHRDIRLTAEVYTDEGLLPLAAAMRELPVLGGEALRSDRMVRSA
jgi:integrase